MNQLLNPKEKVHTLSTEFSYEIEAFLGGGGQGEVYRARLVDRQGPDTPVALKWFFPHYVRQDKNLQARLERAIVTGRPSDRFLWPQALVQRGAEHDDFGYVMPIREERFVGITDLVTRQTVPTFRALVTAGFELAHNYLQLHAEGFCYRDISFGNVFFDPESGEIRICDNDNVSVDDGRDGAISGTARFMAPEIVRGEAGPDTQTDLFSLAVLLFYMLVNHHPLEGAKETQFQIFDIQAMTYLYGTSPQFIFDPDDKSNWPLRGYHDNALALWDLYPRFLQELFILTFTEGLHYPDKRARENQWCSALIRLRDSIFYCQHCSNENFYSTDALDDSNGNSSVCWSCKSSHRLPPRMRIDGKDVVMLNHDTLLYPHHFNAEHSYNFEVPVAEVTQHPKNPRVWGLRNHSEEKWTSQNAAKEVKDVEPGKTVALSSGLRIQFGRREGEVRF